MYHLKAIYITLILSLASINLSAQEPCPIDDSPITLPKASTRLSDLISTNEFNEIHKKLAEDVAKLSTDEFYKNLSFKDESDTVKYFKDLDFNQKSGVKIHQISLYLENVIKGQLALLDIKQTLSKMPPGVNKDKDLKELSKMQDKLIEVKKEIEKQHRKVVNSMIEASKNDTQLTKELQDYLKELDKLYK